MADLKSNSLWSDIRNNPNAALDRVLGPSFDYTTGIKKPEDLGVSDEGSLGQVFTNANAVKTYTQQLITGPLLGNATFVESGGMCKAPNGNVVPRWSYVDNRMRGADALPANMRNALGSSGDVFNGIVPGMMGDIVAMNPIKPINGLVMSGVPPCEAYTCPVTDANGQNPKNETNFLTPALELNLNKCSRASDQSYFEKEAIKSKVKFGNQFDDQEFTSKPYKIVAPTDLTPYVYWGLAMAVLFGIISQKL